MFGRTAKTEIDSLVGISARIEGDLCFTGGLRHETGLLASIFWGWRALMPGKRFDF